MQGQGSSQEELLFRYFKKEKNTGHILTEYAALPQALDRVHQRFNTQLRSPWVRNDQTNLLKGITNLLKGTRQEYHIIRSVRYRQEMSQAPDTINILLSLVYVQNDVSSSMSCAKY